METREHCRRQGSRRRPAPAKRVVATHVKKMTTKWNILIFARANHFFIKLGGRRQPVEGLTCCLHARTRFENLAPKYICTKNFGQLSSGTD